MLSLKELCSRTGVTRRIVQGYEKQKLISANGKNKYGYLLYDDEVIEEVIKIRLLQELGFELKQIKVFYEMDKVAQRQIISEKSKETVIYANHLLEVVAKVNQIF